MITHSYKAKVVPVREHENCYARLYQAVILRAMRDLAQKQHKNDARKWLLSGESDYAFATAGMSPHSIRRLVTEMNKENETRELRIHINGSLREQVLFIPNALAE